VKAFEKFILGEGAKMDEDDSKTGSESSEEESSGEEEEEEEESLGPTLTDLDLSCMEDAFDSKSAARDLVTPEPTSDRKIRNTKRHGTVLFGCACTRHSSFYLALLHLSSYH
jgi:hypothetical protein